MKIIVITLFPKMIESFLVESILGRAQKKNLLKVDVVNLRDYGIGRHKQVDDAPYGGGAGMVLRPDVVVAAIKDAKNKNKSRKNRVILLTPQGDRYNQSKAQFLADELSRGKKNLILVCGRYEGFDERIRDYVDEEISIGDYVLTGGEIAAAAIIDSIARLVPGVLGKEASFRNDSFQEGLLDYPQYTRPEKFDGKEVPKILLSGNHAEIEKWRKKESIQKTKKRRPDLLN